MDTTNSNVDQMAKWVKTQSQFARTVSGREVSESCVALSKKSEGNTPLHQCKNCKIVLLANYFPSGCPNCGAKQGELNE